jgi:hypothetical protein
MSKSNLISAIRCSRRPRRVKLNFPAGGVTGSWEEYGWYVFSARAPGGFGGPRENPGPFTGASGTSGPPGSPRDHFEPHPKHDGPNLVKMRRAVKFGAFRWEPRSTQPAAPRLATVRLFAGLVRDIRRSGALATRPLAYCRWSRRKVGQGSISERAECPEQDRRAGQLSKCRPFGKQSKGRGVGRPTGPHAWGQAWPLIFDATGTVQCCVRIINGCSFELSRATACSKLTVRTWPGASS